MRDAFVMWGNTRMVVLTAISGSLYAAILIPFKVLPIIPGVTELRPANAIPVLCSLLFGPAAAWGAAIGNTIGDFFGGIGPGTIFGFLGNFLYGYVPYKAWNALGLGIPQPRAPLHIAALAAVTLLASAACALTIGWGLNSLGFVPFTALANIILVNNALTAIALTPFLFAAIQPRVGKARLLYSDVGAPSPPRSASRRALGLGLLVVGTVGGMIAGNLLSSGAIGLPEFLATPGNPTRSAEVGLGLLPFLALLVLGLLLL
jgi:energy-coupling factor transport system substrate-specific component